MQLSDRPRLLLPAYSKDYFSGKKLCYFIILCLLVVSNGVLVGLIRESWWAALPIVVGVAGMLVFHVSVCSGVNSSNVGTYFRETEPVRFWASNILLLFGVSLIGSSGWFIS